MGSILTIIITVVSFILILLMVELVIRNRLHKDLQEWKQYKQELKEKPIADELKRVKDLNITGQTEAFFEKWRHDWDEILTVTIPEAERKLQKAESHAAQFSFRKGRAVLNEALVLLEDADQRTDEILHELHNLLESQQKNNNQIEQLRQTYREMKKNVLAYRHMFSLAEYKLEEMLDEALEKFQAFEEETGKGNYLEARNIVLELEKSISYVQLLITEIPDLQVECQSALPSQLDDLLSGYEEMSRQGYVLEHLEIPGEVQELREELQKCIADLQNVEIVKVQERIAFLKEKLDILYDQLEAEATSKHYVEKESYILLDMLEDVREKAAETKEETQFVKQSYELNDKDVEMQKYIEKQINVLLKRYDALHLRIAQQDIAFSVIREEIEDMHEQVEAVKRAHQHYKEMLQTLRKEEFQAREVLQNMRGTMMETKRLLQRSNLPGLPENFLGDVQQAQLSVQRVYTQLEYKPLNMKAVNGALEEAISLVNGTYADTAALIEKAYLVEKVIQYGNRYRSQDVRIAEGLEEAEKRFRQFEYEAALEQAAALLEQLEPGVVQKIEEFIKTE